MTTDEMTPWERRRALAAGEAVDRVPCVPFMDELKCSVVGASVHGLWFDADTMVAVERAAFARWRHDRITVGPNSRGITEAIEALVCARARASAGAGTGAGGRSAAGAGTGAGADGNPSDGVLRDYALLDALDPLDSQAHVRFAPFFQALERLVGELGDVVPVEASIGGPFTIAANLRGIERLLRDCRRRPDEVRRLLRLVADVQKRCIDAAAARGAHVAMADPVANPALIGVRAYEQMVFPFTRELCAYARARCGSGVRLHMCGRTEKIWHCFARLPVDEVSLDDAIDLGQAARDLGRAVPIAGNVDPVRVICLGDAAAVGREVARCVRAGRTAKAGFTLAPGCDIPPGTSLSQVDAFMDAARRCGW